MPTNTNLVRSDVPTLQIDHMIRRPLTLPVLLVGCGRIGLFLPSLVRARKQTEIDKTRPVETVSASPKILVSGRSTSPYIVACVAPPWHLGTVTRDHEGTPSQPIFL